MYGIELIIIIFSTLALSLAGEGPALSIVGVMIFWRVILGTGVGGDYPLSSIITSEFATVKWRGAMMAAVFANQGWGQFTAALVAFICTVGFKNSLQTTTCNANCQESLDKAWRIIYGFGAVPACAALYFRLTIPETIRYTLDVSRNEKVAAADAIKYVSGRHGSAKLGDVGFTPDAQIIVEQTPNGPPQASFRDFVHHFGQWKNGRVLIGTAGSWFLLDVAFYGLGLNTSIILAAIGYAGGSNVYQKYSSHVLYLADCIDYTIPVLAISFSLLPVSSLVIGFRLQPLIPLAASPFKSVVFLSSLFFSVSSDLVSTSSPPAVFLLSTVCATSSRISVPTPLLSSFLEKSSPHDTVLLLTVFLLLLVKSVLSSRKL